MGAGEADSSASLRNDKQKGEPLPEVGDDKEDKVERDNILESQPITTKRTLVLEDLREEFVVDLVELLQGVLDGLLIVAGDEVKYTAQAGTWCGS